ncbi:trehalose utilization-domain-containing protein [Mrakia frigida]|uniref:ThuA domain-containing protein n=1 Tax=Mrakia frigida TaxID=29902 RepID=UPI003FCC2613
MSSTSFLFSRLSSLLLIPLLVLADPSVLVYTRTAGFRHDSIPTAIEAFKQQGPLYNISFSFSENPSLFSDDGLNGFDAIAFVSNSDEVLDQSGKDAFLRWLQKGGNFLGVHAGCACLFTTEFFQNEVGALFDYHPTLQQVTFLPLNTTHPAMTNIPARWTFEEEVYYFRSDPRTVGATVLMTVDESSYNDTGGVSTGTYDQGSPHPIAWYQDPTSAVTVSSSVKAGRSFFTSLGHNNATWEDPVFLEHVMKGLVWSLESGTTRAFDSSAEIGTASNSTTETSSSVLPSSSTTSSGASPSGTTASTQAASPSSTAASTGGSSSRIQSVAMTTVLSSVAFLLLCC